MTDRALPPVDSPYEECSVSRETDELCAIDCNCPACADIFLLFQNMPWEGSEETYMNLCELSVRLGDG